MKQVVADYTVNVSWSLPGYNGRHLADDIFRWIFVDEKFCILTKKSLKSDSKSLIGNNAALV